MKVLWFLQRTCIRRLNDNRGDVMGGVAKVFKSIFGGGSTTVAKQETPAAAAAPEDTTSLQGEENTDSSLKKRRRGKGSLYVALNNSNTNTGGTGLNL